MYSHRRVTKRLSSGSATCVPHRGAYAPRHCRFHASRRSRCRRSLCCRRPGTSSLSVRAAAACRTAGRSRGDARCAIFRCCIDCRQAPAAADRVPKAKKIPEQSRGRPCQPRHRGHSKRSAYPDIACCPCRRPVFRGGYGLDHVTNLKPAAANAPPMTTAINAVDGSSDECAPYHA